MKLINYLNLNEYPFHISFCRDRSNEFEEIYHAHQGMELLYVHSGHGNIIVDGKLVTLSPRNLYCFSPFHMHRVAIDKEKLPYIRSLFVVEPNALEGYLSPFPTLLSFFNNIRKEPFLNICFNETNGANGATGAIENKLSYMNEDLCKQNNNYNSNERLEIDALFFISLINLMRLNNNSRRTLPFCFMSNKNKIALEGFHTSKDIISQILAWLENNFHEEFSLEKLSRVIHMTPNHISYLFHKETGSCITDYLAARRVQEACTLLRTTSLSIQEVGYRVGFNNFSYFCSFFKKKVGKTPLKFKKEHST